MRSNRSYFIDYSKAFDTVRHEPLIDQLKAIDVDSPLANLYLKQKAAVRHNGKIGEWMSFKQGVHQGCVASPHLFAMYIEMIMRRIEDKVGFRIGGRMINNLRYRRYSDTCRNRNLSNVSFVLRNLASNYNVVV